MKKINIAFVGVGFNGQLGHLINFVKINKCKVVAIAEARDKLRKQVGIKYNIKKLYKTHRDLIKYEKNIDGVVIITKRNMTGPIAYDFLKSGFSVFTEKPMASTYKQAKKLVNIAKKNNVIYKIGYNKTYDYGIQKAKIVLKKLLKSKKLGKIVLMRSHRLSGSGYYNLEGLISTNEKNYLKEPYWTSIPDWLPKKYSFDYEKYLNLYSHNINLIRYFTEKKLEIVHSDLSEKKMSTVIFDSGEYNVVLETGFFTKDGWDETFEIYFERGSMKIMIPPQHKRKESAKFIVNKSGISKSLYKFINNKSWSFENQACGFIRDISNKKVLLNSGNDAIIDLEIIEKNLEKIFTNKLMNNKEIDRQRYHDDLVAFSQKAFKNDSIYPKRYCFILTNLCNLACSFCFQDRKKQNGAMTGDDWINLIDQLPPDSRVTLTGGEPIVFKDFKRVFDHVAKKFECNIITNGVLLTEELIDFMLKYKNFKVLSISIDNINNTLRDVKIEKWKHVENMMLYFQKAKSKINHSCTLDSKTTILDTNSNELLDIHKYCIDDLKCDTHAFQFLKGSPIQHSDIMFNLKTIFSESKAETYENWEEIVDQLKKVKRI